MDKTMRTQPILIFLILTMGGFPAYAGSCSIEDIMYEYKNNNKYITDPRSPLWGKGIRNPEYKPILTEWTKQTNTYRLVVDGNQELRCNNGNVVEITEVAGVAISCTDAYTCGPIKILHKLTARDSLTMSYYLIDKKGREFLLDYNILDSSNERCRCVYGPTNSTRSTICTQKLYNEYVNIDFIHETRETERTKPIPQL